MTDCTRRTRFRPILVCGATLAALAAPALAHAAPKATCVPWLSAAPGVPHSSYPGATTTLKGVAREATEYRWDFGDGGGTGWTAISNPYNLGVQHSYAGVPGQLFIATLHVRDAAGEVDQDDYLITLRQSSDLGIPEQLDVRIDMAIDEGLWYLHTNMIRETYAAGSPGYGQPYGYWPETRYGYPLAATGTSVDAFQMHGTKAHLDVDTDPYVETVQRALNYLLGNTYAFAIGPQTHGDPDVNGNGIGLVCNHSSNLYDSRQTYIGGITMTALASSGAPNRLAPCGGDYVHGRPIKDILQDMTDFWAWGQNDSGSARGGWRYYANYGSSDMSTAQWPPLAMLVAEENMGVTVPQFVRDELVFFLDYTQYLGKDNDNGAFGYSYTGDYRNITKAAAGIICHEFVGTSLNDKRVQAAIGYIYRHWNDTGGSWDDTRLMGNSYGMYGVMKAFRIPEPDLMRVVEYDYTAGEQTANSFDWYYTPTGQANQGMASYNVASQHSDGSWDDVVGANPVYDAFATGWRILTLLKGVATIPPTALICDCDEQEYNLNQDILLDGLCSYHQDRNRSIVQYEWDLDGDGVFETSGDEAVIAGGFADEGYYPVTLRVTDDNPEQPQTDTHTCEVYVHPPPHCPHAFADGPYQGWVGVPLTLDAGASWDPDNEIASYEWDLDNDGLFGAEDDDCFGQSSDAVGLNPEWTWNEPYNGVIGLRVTDEAGDDFDPCSDVDYSSVEIGNHAPVSDAGGPYRASFDSCITVDGLGSYDVDPGDSISFAWDLNNDGDFTDCADAECEFCVGSDVGVMYDMCLRVEDSFGEYDIDCTTVEVVLNEPPLASCQNIVLQADAMCSACGSVDAGSEDPDSDPPWSIEQDPACPYGLGTTEVTLTITDEYGESDSCAATVIVEDTMAPEIVCPEAAIVECPGDTSPAATGEATASDNCSVVPVVYGDASIPGPGSTQTILRTWIASDDAGNTASCEQTIDVVDTTPPEVSCEVALESLWPANHEMVDVGLAVSASDVCEPSLAFGVGVTSDEPTASDLGAGGEIYAPDAFAACADDGTCAVELRAERSGESDGRVYVITTTATDASGNVSSASCPVVVDHDGGKDGAAVDSGQNYDATEVN